MEAVVATLKELSRHLPGETGNPHKTSFIIACLNVKIWTHDIPYTKQ